eukprot:2916246-Alexandrium_andersonii.AAC.1
MQADWDRRDVTALFEKWSWVFESALISASGKGQRQRHRGTPQVELRPPEWAHRMPGPSEVDDPVAVFTSKCGVFLKARRR